MSVESEVFSEAALGLYMHTFNWAFRMAHAYDKGMRPSTGGGHADSRRPPDTLRWQALTRSTAFEACVLVFIWN